MNRNFSTWVVLTIAAFVLFIPYIAARASIWALVNGLTLACRIATRDKSVTVVDVRPVVFQEVLDSEGKK
jgi:hypothetical protein